MNTNLSLTIRKKYQNSKIKTKKKIIFKYPTNNKLLLASLLQLLFKMREEDICLLKIKNSNNLHQEKH